MEKNQTGRITKEGIAVKKPTLIVPPQGDILEVMQRVSYMIHDASVIRKMKEQVMETTCYGAALKVINMYVDIRFSDGSTDGLEIDD